MNRTNSFDGHEVVNHICAGIDVHRDKVNVTISKSEGNQVRFYYDVFWTIKSSLEQMLVWLISNGCTVVGMESAGKNLSGRIKVRQHYLRSLLIEVAFASTRCKGTYFNSKFFELKRRKSTQKSVIALARKLSIAVYMIINKGKNFSELTSEYLPIEEQVRDLRNMQRLAKKFGEEATLAVLEQVFNPREPTA